MTGVVSVEPGASVRLRGDDAAYVVVELLSPSSVMVECTRSNERREVLLTDLLPAKELTSMRFVDLDSVSDEKWQMAQEKAAALQEVRRLGGSTADVRRVAQSIGYHPGTLYRWLAKHSPVGRTIDLVRKERSDRGKPRLDERVEKLIDEAIRTHYLSDQKPTITGVYRKLELQCRDGGLKAPSIDTLKSRIARFPAKEAAVARGERKLANSLSLNRGSVQGADRPYSLVQIDHTPVDLHLVDAEKRVSIGRPWITVAIDVFSRMCLGYYVSFDPPGTLGTGLCLTHTILNKNEWMARLGVSYRYPCEGIPYVVHLDNAKEFRGKSLEIACDQHGISLQFRPVRRPQYGAHIERLMGTLSDRIHALSGTTFGNVVEKEEYDSEGKAVMTLHAFERWLAHLILGDYHNSPHSGLNGMSPLRKFEAGIKGEEGLPKGRLRIESDAEQLYMDFLPSFSLTIQQYGIQLDLIKYTADVLRKWVGARDPLSPNKARRFIVKRDPRKIGRVYFKDPETNRYHPIPYANLSHPDISIWEYNEVRRRLRERNIADVDEDTIFHARAEMEKIELHEAEVTKAVKASKRHSSQAKKALRRAESPQPEHGNVVPSRPQVLLSEERAIANDVPITQARRPSAGVAATRANDNDDDAPLTPVDGIRPL